MGRLPTSTGDWLQVISSVFKFPFQSGALALQLLPLDSGLVESVPHGVRYSNTWSPAGDTVWRSYGEVHFFFFFFVGSTSGEASLSVYSLISLPVLPLCFLCTTEDDCSQLSAAMFLICFCASPPYWIFILLEP